MDSIHRTQVGQQKGLFDPAPVLPEWEELPPQTRQEVARLMEKIILKYGLRILEDLAARKEWSSE